MSQARLFAIAVLSAAILAYEILLMRLFSIIWWHHFAYMIISIALLGFGASGTALALTQERLLPRFGAIFATCAALFAVTAVLCFAAAMRLPFNALAIVWDSQQLVWLGLSYALLIVPFFFGGSAIGLAFSRSSQEIGRIYAYDLVGAGLGALGVVAILFTLSQATTLRLVAALGLISAALAIASSPRRSARIITVTLSAAAILISLWMPPRLISLHPHISEYKGLATALLVPDAKIIEERSSPLGLVSVVESPTIPFRFAPGLSLNNIGEPPAQLGIFTDADSMSAITQFRGDLGGLKYLDYTTSALPYHLLDKPEVLVLGAGGGEQVLLALYHGALKIDAVELNPQVLDLVAEDYADFAGHIYDRPEVDVDLGEARSFVRKTDKRYDLIQIPLLYSSGAAAAGTQGLHESYTYTIEAMQDYLRALKPGGMLSATLWLKVPPRDTPKLVATAVEALRRTGADPGRQLALIRSWKTTTLLVKNGPFTSQNILQLRDFAAARSFDVAYYPGISAADTNRYNLLERAYFYEAASALIGPERQDYIESYKFAIAPATDDRPYFFDFFKWRSLPELLALRTQGAASMLDMGYLILVVTLIQAAMLSVLLILTPLVVRRRRFGGTPPKVRTLAYFLALGLAFLFIEIAFMQRFILFLGHPVYAAAVVLAGFLAFAGIGSALTPRLVSTWERQRSGPGNHVPAWARLHPVVLAVAGIGAIAVVYLLLLPVLFDTLIALPDAAKIAISLALIAPLAYLMGMPFPLGIALVARESQDLVPWAWGINGCASVVAAILETLLAIHLGFTIVVALAVMLYLAAPLALRGPAAVRLSLSDQDLDAGT